MNRRRSPIPEIGNEKTAPEYAERRFAGRDDARDEASRLRRFRMNALNDASSELGRYSRPGEIVEAFLLTTLGVMGAASGFFLLFDREEEIGEIVGRGIPQDELALVKAFLPRIEEAYFSGSPRFENNQPPRPHILPFSGQGEGPPFPEDTRLVVKWALDGRRRGLLGLGPKITNRPYDAGDGDFLLSLCALLTQAMRRAASLEDVTRLNRELMAKNDALEKAAAAADKDRAALDRRMFYLKTHNDAVNEMSGLLDAKELIARFLLLAMGGVSAGKGYLALFSGLGPGEISSRGVDAELLLDIEGGDVSRLITHMLFSGDADRGQGARRGFIDDPEVLVRAGLPGDMPGVWFVADEGAFGFCGLGDFLSGEPLSGEQREFLLTQTGALTVFLRKAKLFEQTRRLNLELEAGNRELREALENLTRSRREADGLKQAAERIKSLVRGELGRAGRVNPWDFIIILAISLVVGLFFNYAHPGGVPIIPAGWSRPPLQAVDATLAREAVDAGNAILVDARPREFFEQRRAKGAVNLPAALFDFVYGMNLEGQDPAREIIVYGHTVSRRYDADVAELLRERGHANVKLLSGGLASWEEKGFPVER